MCTAISWGRTSTTSPAFRRQLVDSFGTVLLFASLQAIYLALQHYSARCCLIFFTTTTFQNMLNGQYKVFTKEGASKRLYFKHINFCIFSPHHKSITPTVLPVEPPCSELHGIIRIPGTSCLISTSSIQQWVKHKAIPH